MNHFLLTQSFPPLMCYSVLKVGTNNRDAAWQTYTVWLEWAPQGRWGLQSALQSPAHGLPACIGKVHDCSTATELNVTLPLTPNRMMLLSTVANTPIYEGSKYQVYEVISYEFHHLRVKDYFILSFKTNKPKKKKKTTLRLILAHFWALWPLILHLLYLLWQFSAPFSFHVPNTFLFWYYLW